MDFMNKAQFVCLSTDEKPTALPGYTDELKYSLLLELDTKKIYYFDGDAWVELGKSGDIIIVAEHTETATKDGDNRFVFTPTINQNAFARFVSTLSEDNVMIMKFAIGGDEGEATLLYNGLSDDYYSWGSDNPPCEFWINSDGTEPALILDGGEESPETLTMTYSLKIVPNE